MSLFSRQQKLAIMMLVLVSVFVMVFGAVHFAFAQGGASGTANISVSIHAPVPVFFINSPGAGSLQINWNWDAVSPGYYPPVVSSMLVEISADALNYGTPQNHQANDFQALYNGLAPGDYTARITIYDGGNDYDYIVGPVTLAASGGGGRRIIPPDVTDLTVNGLAYPGPSTVVIFNYDTVFQANIIPDGSGNFQHQTTTLPVGSGTLSFSAKDPDGVLSLPVSMPYSLAANTAAIITGVNLPPTISLDHSVAVMGETVVVKGYGYQNGNVSISVEGPTSRAYLVQASATGAWQISIDTTAIGLGTYDVTAQSTNQNATIASPFSDVLVLQVTSSLPVAPICGNGIVEPPEQCDDGNRINGDGCSDTCQIETALPQSAIDQPVPSVQTVNHISLTYTASTPHGTITAVDVFTSLNGAPYVKYGSFSSSPVQLTNMADGNYEAYSIARDSTGAVELPPATPDATFVINAVVELSVLAYPEKRSPRQGNWSMPASLNLYQPGTQTALYHYDLTTDNQGSANVPAGNIPQQDYTFLLKGASQLSKRLASTAFRGVDLLLDFSNGGNFSLLSGDVHADDYINGLDLSATVKQLYTGFQNADLNRDGIVNGMDLSNIVTNLYKAGDGA